MTFPIYEFSKGFQEVFKNAQWLSGGFGKKIDRSNYPKEFPSEIENAVKNGLFEIPNQYRPHPGAEILIQNGGQVEQPGFESIALIAREIGSYCILAVATGQIDDKGRDLIVGYRYFWLNVKDLENDVKKGQKPDGIATLLYWWFKNGQPCFNMNPHSFNNGKGISDYSQVRFKLEIRSPEEYPETEVILPKLLQKIKTESPPILVNSHQDEIEVNFQDTKLLFLIYKLHLLALKANEIVENCPLAWAWNVRGLSFPDEFAAIFCADLEALDRLVKKKKSIPSKKFKTQKVKSSPEDSGQNEDISAPVSDPHMETPSTPPPGTPANPDPLLIKTSEPLIRDVIQNPQSEGSLIRLVEFYSQHPYPNHNCWSIPLEATINKFSSFPEIQKAYPVEQRYICLLVILNKNNLPTQYFKASQLKSMRDASDFLNSLLSNVKKIKQIQIQSYLNNQSTYDKIEQRISWLLDPESSHTSTVVDHENDETEPPNPPPNPPPKPRFYRLIFIGLVIVAGCIGLGIWAFPNFRNQSFEDIDNHWGKNYIQALLQKKIVTVPPDRKYRPEDKMTRAEFATFLTKAFPDKLLDNQCSESKTGSFNFPFIDVKQDHWSYQGIKNAYCSGFFAGSADSRFYPENKIPRLALLQTLVKGLKLSPEENHIPNLSFYQGRIEQPLKQEEQQVVAIATQKGLIINYDNPCLLEPKDNATRAEVAAILYQALVSQGKATPLNMPKNPELTLEGERCYVHLLEARSEPGDADLNNAREELWKKEEIYAYLESSDALIPKEDLGNLYQQQKLPDLELGKIPEKNKETVKHLKETLKEIGLYQSKIDTEYDKALEQAIRDFQTRYLSAEERQGGEGKVGKKTWSALSKPFKDAHLKVAYKYFEKAYQQGLKNDQRFDEVIKSIKNNLQACQAKGALAYVSCVNNKFNQLKSP